jgi:hypothetical protein
MAVTRRIFVSMPADRWLSDQQNRLKWGVVERIEAMNYVPEIFLDPRGGTSLAGGIAWTADRAEEIARHCHGAVLIGLPRWNFESAEGPVLLPTEFSHYEGALARSLALPTLVLCQENLLRRVVFDGSFGGYVGTFPECADGRWLQTSEFEVAFNFWQRSLEVRRDVFLGYSSSSMSTAVALRDFIENDVGATVLDWQRDFTPGRTILEEIEEARRKCATGIFLFTKDETLAAPDVSRQALPRDNVVFEAGYFMSAKGKSRVLIVLEAGAKIPADLGGHIYASLANRQNLGPVEDTIRKFLAAL